MTNKSLARSVALLLAIVLVATACTIDTGSSTSTGSGTEGGEGIEGSQQADDGVAAPTTSAAPAITGPVSTFVPPLQGPFSSDGGTTTAAVDQSTIIIEENPSLPRTLEGLPWPTDFSRRTVADWNEFLRGLQQEDPRDGIPPIDSPVFESPARAAEWLDPAEPGALVQVNGEARFYPLSIMTQHEIVNDAFGDIPVAVTYCPLCNTAIAFDRRVDGEVLRFGVSGLLRNSDLVMWDDQTTSLWQQITGDGVVGQFAGVELETVPTSIVSFGQFAANFPEGGSLAGESGRGRQSYGANPYVGYSSLDTPFLFDGETDDRLPALSRVVGISDGDIVASYAFSDLARLQVVNDDFDGRPIAVLWAPGTADALDGGTIASSNDIGTAVAYEPIVDGQNLTFTANGDGTFTDDQTSSTWNIFGQATDGSLAGSQLGAVEHRNEFWFAFQAFFGADSLREQA